MGPPNRSDLLLTSSTGHFEGSAFKIWVFSSKVSVALVASEELGSCRKITRSAAPMASHDLSMPFASTRSLVSRKPAVSMMCIGTPPMVILSLTRSLVVPAIGVTIATSSPARRFSRELFPTLGAPAKTNWMPSRKILPCLAPSLSAYSFCITALRRSRAWAFSRNSISSSGKSRVDSTKMRNWVISSIRLLMSFEKSPCKERAAPRTAAAL